MMSVDLGLQQYDDERGRRFLDDLLARAEALPGVTSATSTVHVPLDYGMQFNDVAIDGMIPGTKDGYLSIAYNVVGPRFLETTGARLLARPQPRSDRRRAVAAGGARQRDDGEEAVAGAGRRRPAIPVGDATGDWTEVVGVVRDGKYMMLGEEPRPYFYLPLAQKYRVADHADGAHRVGPDDAHGAAQRVLHEHGSRPAGLQREDDGGARARQRVRADAAAHGRGDGRAARASSACCSR